MMIGNTDGNAEFGKRMAEIHAAYAAGIEDAEKNEIGAIYVRSSVSDDALAHQLEQTLAFAAREKIGVALDHVRCDRSPATVEGRPGLAALQQLLERGQAKVVIVFTLNRFFRNKSTLDKFIEHYQGQHGVRFLEVHKRNDTAAEASCGYSANDEKIALVREVFGMFARGMTLDEIVITLNSKA